MRPGGSSSRKPSASSTSAEPQADETARLPCLATPAPAAAATRAAAVEMLIVLAPSPPVPAVSTRSSRRGRTGRACSRIASAQPAISSAVSPFARSAIKKPAIWAGVASPLMIEPMTARASSRERSRPSSSPASACWITRAPPGSSSRAPARQESAPTPGGTAPHRSAESPPRLRQLDRELERRELPQALLVLRRRVGVGDDPCAGLQERDPLVQGDRANCDARVQRPVRQGIADGARIWTAAVGFELGDDLHRANLWRARDGAGWEAGAQQVEGRDVVAEGAGDLGNEMRDVREALGLDEAFDAHGARRADAREIVAPEVDEHHMLGAVLLRREQALSVAGAGGGRAGDRVQARAASLQLDQRLRRGADEREAVELEQEEVRRRVDPAERPVELERRRR